MKQAEWSKPNSERCWARVLVRGAGKHVREQVISLLWVNFISFLGKGPERGRCPVEHGEIPSVHPSVHMYIPPCSEAGSGCSEAGSGCSEAGSDQFRLLRVWFRLTLASQR